MMYAFFGPDGGLDRAAMGRQVEACLRHGAHGIALLGLGTEVSKLAESERRQVLDWAAEDVAGRVPLAVTVFGETPRRQIAFLRVAQAAGAAWAILQPPPQPGLSEADCERFFAAVMAGSDLPLAIQNALDYLGIGLGPAACRRLRRAHGNFTVLKAEGPALAMARVIAETEGEFAVFNGRAGLELPDNLRAGMIPASETIDRQVCYGKRIAARRLGLGAVHDRAPALAPSPFGLACAERYAAELGAL